MNFHKMICIGYHGLSFCLVIIVLIPLQLLLLTLPLTHPLRLTINQIGYFFLLKSLGISVKVTGTPPEKSPCFYISNHTSYIDILVLGSLLPASFVSKEEVSSWPLVGFFARKQGTLFIQRSKSKIHDSQKIIENRLAQGASLVLFPEGTTNFGSSIVPFKSALFGRLTQVKLPQQIYLQPISISYSHSKGLSLGRKGRWEASWTGDESLLPHFLTLLTHTPLTVHVHFSEGFFLSEDLDRKKTTSKLEKFVSEGLSLIAQGKCS